MLSGSNVTDRWNVPFLSATRGQKKKHVMAKVIRFTFY